MSPRAVVVLISAVVLAAIPSASSARPVASGGYFGAPTSYRVASISYTTSAVRVEHDATTGDLNFVDTQSTRVNSRAPATSSLTPTTIATPIAGSTAGTMTRYYQGQTVGACTYTIPINGRDQLLLNFTRRGTSVEVTFIDSVNQAGYCGSTGGDAEAFNWYLPSKTYSLSGFRARTIVLNESGTHTDYPQSSSYNTWKWHLTITLRRAP
jgi:hypothetical protein